MEWTCETGELVAWQWSQPKHDDSGEPQDLPYPIGIHIDGRRLRGTEAKRWKERIEAEFDRSSPEGSESGE